MAVAQPTLALEQFLDLPEEEPALEYFDGVIEQKVSPQADHGRVQSYLLELFNRAAMPERLGLAFSETRFSTDRYAPVPDISFYVRNRIRAVSHRKLGDFKEPPDIAVEILSPGQSVSSQVRKCLLYLDVGVRVALLVDQDDETVFDFRPGVPMRALRGPDRIDLADILPRFELTVEQLFDDVVPSWLREDAAGPD